MSFFAQDDSNCSVGRAVSLVGQPWVILILRDVTQGVRRFSDLQAHLGVSRSVLSDRLEHMVTGGILELRDYQEPGSRRRSEYHLTEMGRDLYPALTALRVWGDKYLADPEGPATEVLHRDCGAPVRTALMCAEGHVISTDDLERRPGPGARMRAA